MTLVDETELTLTNEEIWENGVTIDNAISSDSSFDIGSAIVGSLTLVIDNIKGNFNIYDFLGASLWLYIGVTGDVDEHDEQVYYRINRYVVDNTSYNGSLITLDCLDNMTYFDVPFSEVTGVSYPTTAGQLVAALCSHCGVTLGTVTFQNYTMSIPAAPDGENNCREVLQYVAQKCCCYCKINTAGELALTWYDKNAIIGITNYDGGTYLTTTTPYSDGCDLDGGHFHYGGDTADGGTFAALQSGAWLTQNYDLNIGTDDIVVTGCRVRKTSGEDAYDELWVDSTLEETHERYVLVIEDNPFITSTEAATIAATNGAILAGLPIREYSANSLNDMSFETGDMATIVDFRGNRYYSWITSLTFTIGNSESFACGVESLRKRSETRYSGNAKTLAEAAENASQLLSDYDNAVKAMDELAQEAISYSEYIYPTNAGVGTSRTVWRYNGGSVTTTAPASVTDPYFPSSTVVFKISGDGVFVATGDDIDPITGEVLQYSNGYDANSGTAILNLVYAIGLNCDWIHAGTLTLGGNNNANGTLKILNASGAQIGSWDNTGINATNGSFGGSLNAATGSFKGSLTAATGTITDGVGTLSIESGDLHMVKSADNGSGVFCAKLNTPYQSIWGATISSSQDSYAAGGYIYTYTKNIVQAGISASDRRLKKNIKDLDADFAKALILGIEPKSFNYKVNKGLPAKLQYGVIAQDVLEVLKGYGVDEENQLCYEEMDGMLSVQYKQLIAPMIKVIQSQQEELDLLKQEVADLKARVK